MKESMAEKAAKYMGKVDDLENGVELCKKEIEQYKNQQGIHEELIIEHTKTIHAQIAQIEKLKAQNKLLWDALIRLPTQELRRVLD